MKRCVLLLLCGVCLTASRADDADHSGPYSPWVPPAIVAMEITPEQPTSSDEVTIAVSCRPGSFCTWDKYDNIRLTIEDNEFWLDMDWEYNLVLWVPGQYDPDAPDGAVRTQVETFTRLVGPLDIGEYRLHVTNYWTGLRSDGRVLNADEMTFTVSAPDSSDGTDDGSRDDLPIDDNPNPGDDGTLDGENADSVCDVDAAPAETCDCFCHRWQAFFAGRPCPFCGCDPSHSSGADDSDGGSLLDSVRQRIAALRQK